MQSPLRLLALTPSVTSLGTCATSCASISTLSDVVEDECGGGDGGQVVVGTRSSHTSGGGGGGGASAGELVAQTPSHNNNYPSIPNEAVVVIGGGSGSGSGEEEDSLHSLATLPSSSSSSCPPLKPTRITSTTTSISMSPKKHALHEDPRTLEQQQPPSPSIPPLLLLQQIPHQQQQIPIITQGFKPLLNGPSPNLPFANASTGMCARNLPVLPHQLPHLTPSSLENTIIEQQQPSPQPPPEMTSQQKNKELPVMNTTSRSQPPLPSTATTTTTTMKGNTAKTLNKAALNIQIPPPPPPSSQQQVRVIHGPPSSTFGGTLVGPSQDLEVSSVDSSVSSPPSTVLSVISGVTGGPSIESGLIENITSKKKRGTTRENIILLDSILRERRDIFYAMLNNVSKIRIYRKNKSKKMKQKGGVSTLDTSNLMTTTTTTTTSIHSQAISSGGVLDHPKKKISSSKIDTGNEYVVKLNNGLKCEAYEKSTAEEMELYGHKRQFKVSMYYTQNEMDRAESEMMDPSPLIREDRFTFLDQLRGLKPSIQTSYRVIDLIHPYHLFTTEMEIIEPKSGRLLGRVLKKTLLKTHYLIQTVEGKTENEKPKYSTLFTLYKQKKKQHVRTNGVKRVSIKTPPSTTSGLSHHQGSTITPLSTTTSSTITPLSSQTIRNNQSAFPTTTTEPHRPQTVLDFFVVFNLNEEVVATLTRKCNPDYEKKGYFSDYHKVHFISETTPYERTLILAAVFLLDIEHFGN
ncbi:hypothetical protein FDP41_009250 [Naegleria fowleri]|uniref:Tubby C-terminal domain-containing protein n=1 Tax=Naegleria fowleri TaxID=5763 RepID=A0A6A5B223_NAEFO|nr:uncharacterized protein FDP41_009250 [Naegleria fowleri]KAF0972347.1 hypothetical protein FDP41_009250 [Naegleria fowleri]CAG4711531.1 unnamed protein product [Naegleria fowleri]